MLRIVALWLDQVLSLMSFHHLSSLSLIYTSSVNKQIHHSFSRKMRCLRPLKCRMILCIHFVNNFCLFHPFDVSCIFLFFLSLFLLFDVSCVFLFPDIHSLVVSHARHMATLTVQTDCTINIKFDEPQSLDRII